MLPELLEHGLVVPAGVVVALPRVDGEAAAWRRPSVATAWANAQYESPFQMPSSTKTRVRAAPRRRTRTGRANASCPRR